jgi:hypothetical protein
MEPTGLLLSPQAPRGEREILPPGHAPLSFTQLSHWHLGGLAERRSVRQIVSATHLQGPLNAPALQKSLDESVRRHQALRSRIVLSEGVPLQEVLDSCPCEIEYVPLPETPRSQRHNLICLEIERFVKQPVDISRAPLFGVRVLRLSPDEHVLIVAMEHSISDASSLRILLRDLFEGYFQVLADREIVLPPVGIQFPDYAMRQRRAHSAWLAKHGSYWSEHLGAAERLTFPQDDNHPVTHRIGWDMAPFRLESPLKLAFTEVCRAHRVTLPIGMFAAYAAFVLCWCKSTRGILLYQSDGRLTSRVQNTIGLFAAVLYLEVEIRPSDRFGGLLSRVMEEYCNACEHFDYGFTESRVPRPPFTRNSGFSWIPPSSAADGTDGLGTQAPLELTPLTFDHPLRKTLERDFEPSIGFHDRGNDIDGGVHFPLARLGFETAARFAQEFLAFLTELARQPEASVMDIARGVIR